MRKHRNESQRRRAVVDDGLPEAEDISELFFTAQSLQQAGDNEGASRLYCRLLALEPRHFEALNHLAEICYASNGRRDALHLWQQSLAVRPQQGAIWLRLGQVQEALGDNAAALRSYEQAENFADSAAEARLALMRLRFLAL